jgi:hypothetical protein
MWHPETSKVASTPSADAHQYAPDTHESGGLLLSLNPGIRGIVNFEEAKSSRETDQILIASILRICRYNDVSREGPREDNPARCLHAPIRILFHDHHELEGYSNRKNLPTTSPQRRWRSLRTEQISYGCNRGFTFQRPPGRQQTHLIPVPCCPRPLGCCTSMTGGNPTYAATL